MGKALKRGLSLLELVTALGVTGVLLALLLPAIQRARESSRNIHCENNLKQITLGAHQFQATHGSLPANGWGFAWLGDPDRGVGSQQPGGWIYQLLPYLDVHSLADLGRRLDGQEKQTQLASLASVPVSIFRCPTRPSIGLVPMTNRFTYRNTATLSLVARTDYAVNEGDFISNTGSGPASLREGDSGRYEWTDTQDVTGISWQRKGARFTDITRGTSNTYFAGEKNVSVLSYDDHSDLGYDQSLLSGVDLDVSRWTISPPRRDGSEPRSRSFGSAHSAHCNIAMCDGSVRRVSYSIHPEIHRVSGKRRH